MKKNNKGFTLVELIVVVAIFGIILGAILNIIRPTQEIYNDTDETMHTNTIGSGLAEYIDDELRYATNVLVFENYAGVPEVTNTGLVGNYKCEFTNCLVLDNRNLRGSNLKGFSSSADTVANRMGATGAIIKVSKLNTEGFNFNNSVVVKGVDFYDKYKFEFNKFDKATDKMFDLDSKDKKTGISSSTNLTSVENNTTNKEKFRRCLYLKVQAFVPRYEGGKYVFTKSKFNKLTAIDLINININNGDEFNLLGSPDFSVQGVDFYSLCGTDQASAPADATDGQKLYYDTDEDNTYTYIFYKKESTATKPQCTLKFYRDITDPDQPGAMYTTDRTAQKGSTYKNFPLLPDKTGYQPGYWKDQTTGNKIDPSAGFLITGDTTFICIYEPEEVKPSHDVTYLNYDGSVYQTVPVMETSTCPNGITAPSDIPEDKYFIGWVLVGDESKTPSDCVMPENPGPGTVFSFKPSVGNNYKVEFRPGGEGTEIDDSKTIYVKAGDQAIWTGEPPEAPSGKVFDKFVHEGTGQSIADVYILSDSVFYATFKDESAEPEEPSQPEPSEPEPTEPETPTPSSSSTTLTIHIAGQMVGNKVSQIWGNPVVYSLNGGSSVSTYCDSIDIDTNKDITIVFSNSDLKIKFQYAAETVIPNDGGKHEITFTSNGWGGVISGS